MDSVFPDEFDMVAFVYQWDGRRSVGGGSDLPWGGKGPRGGEVWGDFGYVFMDGFQVGYEYWVAGRWSGGGGSDFPWRRKGPRGRGG